MKRICTLMLLATFSIGLFAQELDSLKSIMDNKTGNTEKEIQDDDKSFSPIIVDEKEDEVNVKILERDVVKVTEQGDSTVVKVGEKGIIEVVDQPDSTSIRVGDKEIRIVERNNQTDIRFQDIDKEPRIHNPKFRGHWAGVEWGINNFMDNDYSLSRESDAAFMDLNTGRSWAFNLNFAQYSLGFGTTHIGLLTGLGLEFSNYFFDNDNSILETNDSVGGIALTGNIAKSKLTTTYLRVPLILEVQFPHTVRAKRVFLSAGIVGALKLGSHTKVVSKENGKNKDKNRDDFNINPLRYGLTARLGFGNVCVFGDYYLSTMFVKDKGPELHPFTLGFAMNF